MMHRFAPISALVLGLMSTLGLCMCGPREEAHPPAAPAPVASSPAQTVPSAQASAPMIVDVASGVENPSARDSLPATIELAIGLLRSRDYRTLIEQLVDPEDLAKIEARGQDLGSLAADFGNSDKPQSLLDALLSIQGKEPELSDNGDVATFEGDPASEAPGRGRLRFHRVGERWYLRN